MDNRASSHVFNESQPQKQQQQLGFAQLKNSRRRRTTTTKEIRKKGKKMIATMIVFILYDIIESFSVFK